jgi:glycosyltransferase involved in cell wall biosynthesis
MERDIDIPAERISYLKPGTDLRTFHPHHKNPEVFETFGLPRRSIKALYVGRITKDKNILFLIDVWKELRRRNPDLPCDLLLVGEGYHRKLAPKLAAERIHFLGPVVGETLSQLYASCDLFLFPSVADTLGQVVMEAQASALPVVVSDQGGPQSLVNANGRRSGFVVPGNDKEAWVTAVEALLRNQKLRRQLGDQGHENMNFFNIENSFKHFALMHEQTWEEQEMA